MWVTWSAIICPFPTEAVRTARRRVAISAFPSMIRYLGAGRAAAAHATLPTRRRRARPLVARWTCATRGGATATVTPATDARPEYGGTRATAVSVRRSVPRHSAAAPARARSARPKAKSAPRRRRRRAVDKAAATPAAARFVGTLACAIPIVAWASAPPTNAAKPRAPNAARRRNAALLPHAPTAGAAAPGNRGACSTTTAATRLVLLVCAAGRPVDPASTAPSAATRAAPTAGAARPIGTTAATRGSAVRGEPVSRASAACRLDRFAPVIIVPSAVSRPPVLQSMGDSYTHAAGARSRIAFPTRNAVLWAATPTESAACRTRARGVTRTRIAATRRFPATAQRAAFP